MRRAVVLTAWFVVVFLAVCAGTGALVFARADGGAVTHVDAIVVLGGEHDGREDYGIELALGGFARTVVLSNPYDADDPVMPELCGPGPIAVEVICARPDPPTTRGEAIMIRKLARERGWRSVLVITWRFHLPRARYIFERCLSDVPASVVAVAVPRSYDYSLLEWEMTFVYQYGAMAKAVVQGSCTG